MRIERARFVYPDPWREVEDEKAVEFIESISKSYSQTATGFTIHFDNGTHVEYQLARTDV